MTWSEIVADDEAARFTGYANELREMQKARARNGKTPRALHAKQHVGAVGQLVVTEQPGSLRPALFAQPATWPAYARFSNGSGARQHDGLADVRAIAIKLVGVPGKKLIPGLEDKRTQDFLFIQVPATPFRGPDEFVSFVRIAASGKALLVPRLIGAFGLGRTLSILRGLASMPKVTSMAAARFYTATPVRFGETAAKLALFPLSTAAGSSENGRDALRADLVSRLKAGPIEYSLRAQLFIDEATTPIEDASVVWPEAKTPFFELGRLILSRQDVLSTRGQEIEELVERLSFDPWHAVEELRPLGAMMRARSHAYRESVIERQASAEPEEVVSL
jgi:hypothetical protein